MLCQDPWIIPSAIFTKGLATAFYATGRVQVIAYQLLNGLRIDCPEYCRHGIMCPLGVGSIRLDVQHSSSDYRSL